jgi:hypothetical protein
MSAADLGKAREAKHSNLADRLAGRLQPLSPIGPAGEEPAAPAPQPAPEPDRAEAPAAPAEQQAESKPARRRGSGASKPARTAQATDPSEDGDKRTASVQISLPVSLDARLRAYKERTRQSHPNILFDALETTYDRLPSLVGSAAKPAEAPVKALFNRPRPVTVHAATDEPYAKPILIRISEENKAVIDDLVAQTGASSRNALFVAAFKEFLPTD